MMKTQKIFILALIVFAAPYFARAQEFGHKGLLSFWGTAGFQKPSKPQLGLRYIPEFSLAFNFSRSTTLDSEFSLHSWGTASFNDVDDIQTDGNIKPYRMRLRLSLAQFEARVGLQKISFGSSSLLRPLMWFDSLDPRDPLQLTDGVYGLLLRYYFVNNTNIWLWGLYGNEKTKGWEAFPTKKDSVEYGGRLQVPIFTGELAVTYHHRQADITEAAMLPFPGETYIAPEDRYAVDGKWDIGVGFWVEGTLVHQKHSFFPAPWQRAFNIGLDYTFGVGNGLYAMMEHFNIARTKEAFGSGEATDFSAVLLRYPLGLLDDITGIVYYDWDNKEWYRFVSWQRTYDRWQFSVMAFWNPQAFQIYRTATGNNPFTGKGFQATIVFNY